MSRATVATIALGCLALACAGVGSYDRTPAGLRREVARRVPGIDPASIVVPFEVGEPALELARARLEHVDEDKQVDTLVAALSDPDGFDLHYEWATSGTAAETLERHAGNCLALSSTLIGIARGVGMQASYLEVKTFDPTWLTDGDIAVQADHIAAVIEGSKERRFVDFSGRLARARWVRRIDDFEALAHFYNNRGYEVLNREGTGEETWRKVLPDFELATRIDPSNARAWNNLGVAHARLGDDAAARADYESALAADPGSQSAHLNLVSLYLRAGEPDLAAQHLEAARQLDPRNPQIERLSGSLPHMAPTTP